MKNVATPLSELHAAEARRRARNTLAMAVTVTAAEKEAKLQAIDDSIADIKDNSKKMLAELKNTELPETEKERRRHEIAVEEEAALIPLEKQRAEVEVLLTEDDRIERLAEIDREAAAANQKYGLQPLTEEDTAQRNAD